MTQWVSKFRPTHYSLPTILLAPSPPIELYVLDRQIPVRLQDFEAALLFFLVRFLIGTKLLDNRGAVEIVVGNRCVLEDDGHAIIPALAFRHVIPRRHHAHFQHAPEFSLFLKHRIMVFLEERQEFVSVAPFRLVVVLDRERLFFSFRGHCALPRSGSNSR